MDEREAYKTAQGEEIEIWQDKFGRWIVTNYLNDECRWHLEFDKRSDALAEFNRWR